MTEALTSSQFIQKTIHDIRTNAKHILTTKKFQSTYFQTGNLITVTFQQSNHNQTYEAKFIFDTTTSTLYISGDIGYGIFSWHSSQNTFWNITEFAKRPGYFISKHVTNSEIHEYNLDLAGIQIQETANEIQENPIDISTKIDEFKSEIDDFNFNHHGFTPDEIETIHTDIYGLDPNNDLWLEDEPDYGRIITPRLIFWLTYLTELKNYPITFIPKLIKK